jgi:hypothetical protein
MNARRYFMTALHGDVAGRRFRGQAVLRGGVAWRRCIENFFGFFLKLQKKKKSARPHPP